MPDITYGSVCSGIEAATQAWHPLGMRAAWFAEIEPFPSAVLAHHYPDVPNLGDMTKLAALVLTGKITAPDVLVGGTPCQAFSVAGMREGLTDPRGALTIKYVELADAVDYVRASQRKPASVIVWENVPGVLSDKGNAFGCFLGALAGEDCELQPPGKKWQDAGCVYGPKRTIAWRVLDAQYFGLAQRRRRVFVVASARDGFDPLEVLFERDGVRRDTAPSRESREDVAGTLSARTSGGGGLGTDFDLAGGVQAVTAFTCKDYGGDAGPIAPTLRAMNHSGSHANAGGQVAVCVTGEITHTLKAEGFDGSEDGTGRGQPIVTCDVVGTMSAAGGTEKKHGFGWGQQDWENGYCQPMGSAMRRLTPAECERLQGFPDNYTSIPWRKKPESECPDGPRYKAIGNSKAVTVVRWIGRRLLQQL